MDSSAGAAAWKVAPRDTWIGWIHVGSTQGRSRQDRSHTLQVPVKDIYLYPLTPDFRERLLHE